MKSIQLIIIGLALAYAGSQLNAQNQNDSVKITYKNKTVTIKPMGDESYTTVKFKDTLLNKKIVVRVAVDDLDNSIEKHIEDNLDTSSKKIYDMIKPRKFSKDRKKFIETAFLPTLDIGFASTTNENSNSKVYTPKLNKSANINIGLVRQNMNLIGGQFLLSYGLNLNNYYLKYDNIQEIQYLDEQGRLNAFVDTVNVLKKNRQDLRYFSVPVLLEYHTKNNNFNIAAGVELGFNGWSKLVLKGENDGNQFKTKSENDIKISNTQINAVLRIGFDNFAIFGKYGVTDMHIDTAYEEGKSPKQHIFSFGICVLGI